jgi:hypothetical protein
MRNTQRILALAGMTMVAGATIGMSSSAAFAAPAPNHHDNNGGGQNFDNHHGGDGRWDRNGHDTAQVAGVFHSRRACNAAGMWGMWADKWDSFDCDRHGRVYVLEVERHRGDWHRGGHHHGHGH